MNSKSKVPQIRFRGFSGEWEEKKLCDEVLSIGTGKSKFLANAEKSENIPYAILGSRTIIGYSNEYDYMGDFILTARVGENAGTLYKYSGKVKITDNTVYIKSQNLDYIFYLLIKYDLKRLSFGTGQPLIKASELNNLKLKIATDKTEQTKIGDYFQKLDKLIEQKEKKYQKLKQFKKAMLSKMFPKNGANTPEIRFKGFSGEWEEKRLDDIADLVGGGTPSTCISDYWNGDIDWYSPTEIGKMIYVDGSVKKITQLGLEKSSAKVLPANKTILFTSRAGIGDMAILNKDGTTNQGFQSLVLKDKYDTYFVYSAGYLIKEYALKNSSGSTFLEISGKQLSNMIIRMPSFEEQTKIGNYFQKLDSLIDLQLQELQKLKNIKKASLAKMFV